MQQIITGIIASPGIKIGKAYVYHGSNLIIPKYTVEPRQGGGGCMDPVQQTLEKTKSDIKAHQEQYPGAFRAIMATFSRAILWSSKTP